MEDFYVKFANNIAILLSLISFYGTNGTKCRKNKSNKDNNLHTLFINKMALFCSLRTNNNQKNRLNKKYK